MVYADGRCDDVQVPAEPTLHRCVLRLHDPSAWSPPRRPPCITNPRQLPLLVAGFILAVSISCISGFAGTPRSRVAFTGW